MYVRFRGFDVVVKVVTERLDVGDALLSSLSRQMAWEQDCFDISSKFSPRGATYPYQM